MVRLPRNEKQTYRLNAKASNATIMFGFGHDLDLEFSRLDMEFLTSQPKVVRLPWNEKQTYRLNSRPQMWPMGLTLTMSLTFEFWRSNVTLTFWLHTWSWPWIFMVKFWNSCISEWEGRGGSRSLMAMTMTIWWPRSGVWIYQIVTGVTSVVGVPSTHLVFIMGTPYTGKMASLYWIGLQILNPGYDRDCHLWGKISHGMLSALNPVGTDVNVQGYHWLSSFRLSSLPGTTIT